MPFDVLLLGGEVIDGSGAPAQRTDIGLRQGRIAAIGHLAEAEARLRLDCTGQIVCPGFIDIHSHSDLTLLDNPRAESMIRMGVTTQAIGQCGLGVFPVRPGYELALKALCTFLDGHREIDWHTPEEYLQRLRDVQPAINVVPLLAHSPVRAFVLGFEHRPATAEEIAAMKEIAHQTLAAGLRGISLGLAYALGSFAKREELFALATEAAAQEKLMSVHLRNEGVRVLEALEEIVSIAKRAAEAGTLRLQIAHLKCSGQAAWGLMPRLLEKIEQVRAEGLDIAFDVYPYTAGSRHLSGSLPTWMHEGGPAALVQRLRDPASRQRLREELAQAADDPRRHHPFELPFEDILITDVQSDENRWAVGLRLAEIAERRGQEPFTATLDLLAEEEGHVSACFFSMSEEDMKLALQHPLACVATDGLAFAPYGLLSAGRPHPRSYGTYPRLLGRYVREKGLLSLMEAIRKCTSWPASRLGFTDRGLLREGYAADIVVFDPQKIVDQATYAAPHQYPVGVRYVFVNGVLTITEGKHTGAGAGQILIR